VLVVSVVGRGLCGDEVICRSNRARERIDAFACDRCVTMREAITHVHRPHRAGLMQGGSEVKSGGVR
jgi:hypothetical protein